MTCPLVTSSCLCKYGEGAGFPFQIEPLEDGVEDAVHTFYVHKTHHGTGSTPLSVAKTSHARRINHLATRSNWGVPIRFLP
jgi:hypothetical protein